MNNFTRLQKIRESERQSHIETYLRVMEAGRTGFYFLKNFKNLLTSICSWCIYNT